ncbi:hypothetical protein IJS64_04300 [bacterium]|nr:hypothetical protein [bacterium]
MKNRSKIGLINTYSRFRINKKEKESISRFESTINVYKKGTKLKCLICGKEVTSFCKSHSLPQFVLKTVSTTGLLKTGLNLQSNSSKDKVGIKNCLTFYDICSECDGSYFQNYEHESTFYGAITDEALNEIATKNYLKYYFKQLKELNRNIEYRNRMKSDLEMTQFFNNQIELNNFNIRDTKKKIEEIIKNKKKHNYFIIDEIDLSYSTMLAYQGFVTLTYGFDGLINNIYNYNEWYHIRQLGLCVFPHSKGTKIILFCEEGATKLKYFYKTFRNLPLKKKLYVINYILLLYEEEWAIDYDFNKRLNKETKLLINQHDTAVQELKYGSLPVNENDLIKSVKPYFELKTEGNIFNFLEENIK